jgi:hypothetical protein
MKYTEVPVYNKEGNWVGIEQTWVGTVAEIEEEFPVKILYFYKHAPWNELLRYIPKEEAVI